MQKVLSFITTRRPLIIAALSVTILFCVYQFYTPLNQMVAWGLLPVFPGSMLAFVVAPWLVGGMLGAVMAIIYRIADAKNSIAAALIGFSFNFFIVSLLVAFLEMTPWQEIAIGVVVAFVVFLATPLLFKKIPINPAISIFIGGLLLASCVYAVPRLTVPIFHQKYVEKKKSTFEVAVGSLDFTPYYPTFQSGQYPASTPRLNGYSGEKYSKVSVTYLLGQAQVRQSALLKHQEQVMNFTDNCDSLRLWSPLSADDSISQYDVDSSKKKPQKCEMIHVTPSGKKVYFNDRGNVVFFYMQLDRTNYIIQFDNDNGEKYNSNSLPEILNILDSLKPLDKNKLNEGDSLGDGFSS